MKVKELRELLEDCNDDMEILAEEKISGEVFDFDTLMSCYQHNGSVVFYQR